MNQADLLAGHLAFAGMLSLVFALVTVSYLCAAQTVSHRLTPGQTFLLHTLYLGWQTNVGFMSVVALNVVHGIVRQQPVLLDAGWRLAPWMPVSAAVLYAAMLVVSIAYWWQLRKR